MPHPLSVIGNGAPPVTVQFFIPDPPFPEDMDHAKSREAGHPVYCTIEYVRVFMPGNDLNKPVQRAHDKILPIPGTDNGRQSYAEAFADEYRRFKAGLAEQISGTPLSELTSISAARRAELKAINIVTVEQLAGLDATSHRKIGMDAQELQTMARIYLEKSADNAVGARIAAENAALKAEIDALREEIRMVSEVAARQVGTRQAAAPEAEPDVFGEFDDEMLRTYIKERTGKAPVGRVSRQTLLRMAADIRAAENAEAAA